MRRNSPGQNTNGPILPPWAQPTHPPPVQGGGGAPPMPIMPVIPQPGGGVQPNIPVNPVNPLIMPQPPGWGNGGNDVNPPPIPVMPFIPPTPAPWQPPVVPPTTFQTPAPVNPRIPPIKIDYKMADVINVHQAGGRMGREPAPFIPVMPQPWNPPAIPVMPQPGVNAPLNPPWNPPAPYVPPAIPQPGAWGGGVNPPPIPIIPQPGGRTQPGFITPWAPPGGANPVVPPTPWNPVPPTPWNPIPPIPKPTPNVVIGSPLSPISPITPKPGPVPVPVNPIPAWNPPWMPTRPGPVNPPPIPVPAPWNPTFPGPPLIVNPGWGPNPPLPPIPVPVNPIPPIKPTPPVNPLPVLEEGTYYELDGFMYVAGNDGVTHKMWIPPTLRGQLPAPPVGPARPIGPTPLIGSPGSPGGTVGECPVCADATCRKLGCGHPLCKECMKGMQEAACPICRAPIEALEETLAENKKQQDEYARNKAEWEARLADDLLDLQEEGVNISIADFYNYYDDLKAVHPEREPPRIDRNLIDRVIASKALNAPRLALDFKAEYDRMNGTGVRRRLFN